MKPFSLGWYLPLLVHEGSLIQPSDAYAHPDARGDVRGTFGTGGSGSAQDLQCEIEHRNDQDEEGVVMTTNRLDDGYDGGARGSATRSARCKSNMSTSRKFASDAGAPSPNRKQAVTDNDVGSGIGIGIRTGGNAGSGPGGWVGAGAGAGASGSSSGLAPFQGQQERFVFPSNGSRNRQPTAEEPTTSSKVERESIPSRPIQDHADPNSSQGQQKQKKEM